MALTKVKLKEVIELRDSKNTGSTLGVDHVRGISIEKKFIPTKAKMSSVKLDNYSIVSPGDFAFVTVTSRNSNKITIARNESDSDYLVSATYVVFSVSETSKVLPEYLSMYFSRPEFDRYARYNSWGSARETFSWQKLCETEILLPPLDIQQKYVNIYASAKAIQRLNESSLQDLLLSAEMAIDAVKTAPHQLVGDFMKAIDRRNGNGALTKVMGLNISKQFMPSLAKVSDEAKQKYKIVLPGEFGYSAMQTGRDKCIRIALNTSGEPALVSPAYSILQITDEGVLPEFIQLWFSRKESDRYGWFASDSSIRANLDLPRFFETEVPIPSLKMQESIISMYKAYLIRNQLNARLKNQLKDMCPILIKGAIEEARRMENSHV